MIAKTSAERVQSTRDRRKELGMKRYDVYAHPEDWPAIKELAARLQRKRQRKPRSTKP